MHQDNEIDKLNYICLELINQQRMQINIISLLVAEQNTLSEKTAKLKKKQQLMFATFTATNILIAICLFFCHSITSRHNNMLERVMQTEQNSYRQTF
jgi:hypothetical protein